MYRIVRVRKTRKNRQALRAIHVECFRDFALLPTRNEYWWIAYVDDCPVAFASVRICGRKARFHACGVMPEFRGRGLQTQFLKERLAFVQERGCQEALAVTEQDNEHSMRNLESFGFVRREKTCSKYVVWRYVVKN